MNPVMEVYRHVLDDVIHHVKPEFENEGLDDHVLHHLQQLWERKLMESNVFAVDPPAGAAVDGATGGSGESAASAAPAVSATSSAAHGDASSNLMAQLHASLQHRSAPPSADAASSAAVEAHIAKEMESVGQPQQYMPPASTWEARKPEVGLNVSGEKNIGQHDGTCEADEGAGDGAADGAAKPSRWEIRRLEFLERMRALQEAEAQASKRRVSQVDGGDDEDSGAATNSDEELGSDDDDTDEEPIETDNRVLCKFEKVIRIKTKRKCQLKDGIMHLNGKDYMFGKANGEFEF